MGTGNCTKQFYVDLEEQFLLSPSPDQTVLCSVFADLMECIDEASSSLSFVSQRVVQTLGSKMVSQLTELCQAASVSPCEVGDPLKDENGDQYFCGRGSSGFCPSDSRCVISSTDSYAVCCAKVKNSTEKDCGSAPADLVFLVDESSSIGNNNFQIQKNFVKSLIDNSIIAVNIHMGVMQVALVTFSADPVKRFGLNTYNTTEGMFANIDSIPYDKRGTQIEKGLKYVREVTLTEAEGARSEAPKIVILLTDGSSNDDSEKEANLLRDMDVTLLVIGVGNVDMDQLKAIAANDKFLFTVSDFSELSGIAEQFVASIPCPDEPLTCHLSEAVQCYKGQARSLLSGLLPIAARDSVCSTTEVYSDCVTNLTVTCSSEKQQKFLQVSQWTKQLVKTQGICQSPEDYTPKYCRPEEAAPCLATMSKMIARYQHTPIRSAICSHIVPTETCVLKSIKDCDEERRRSVLQAYQDMTMLARLACVAPQVPKPMPPDCEEEGRICNDIEALNCLVTAHTKLVASKESKETVCK
ncbi:cartilage matrix protein-like [Pecten maximus]|uniref:cartilage matrix protein-like n=1 Tax=Pecten maximus TaxID=6579 RepID=UPI0014582A81|nr:cartilage matrix protein-like [Pecten maximus]